MLQHKALLFTAIIILVVPAVQTGASIKLYNSTAEVPKNDLVLQGSTVVLVCTETPTPQQVDYQWTCPSPPCVGQYRKVYGNVLVVIATTATIGRYNCTTTTTPPQNEAKHGLIARLGDQLTLYSNDRLLLPNTLFTLPDDMTNALTCRRKSLGGMQKFRRESDNADTEASASQDQSITVQAGRLHPNGEYWCYDGNDKRIFFVYFSNATLQTPQVSDETTTTDKVHLLLITPLPYNSGRFILRYDCTLGEADIEVEYRSVNPGVNSNTSVTRNRSCFVLGEISRVTVWFVNGGNISTTPAVVDVNSTNIPDSGTTTSTTSSTTSTATTAAATTPASSDSSTQTDPPSIQSTTNETHTKNNKSSLGTDNNILVPYIGSGAGSLLLVLVVVLAVIICCVVAVHRRGKRSRSTDHTPTLHYYSTPGHEQEEEPQVQIGADNYDTVVEKTAFFTLGTLYDEIEVKPVKSKPVAVPSEYQLPLVEAIKEDDKEVHNTVTIPESFYAQPDTIAKSNKKGEKGTTADIEDPDMLYAEVDKPKKKKKKGKEKKEEQPQGDLYAVVDKTSKKKGKGKKTKEKEQQGDEDLYAEVDKTKKKGKKCQKDKESNSFREAAVELDSPPPVPDRGLIYEPSADREASDQEQHHHQQQLQQQQQQEPEQQQQQLQKQEHEEGVEKQELQEQENTGPGKPSLN